MRDLFLLTVETITFECTIFSKFQEEGGGGGNFESGKKGIR